MVATIPLRMTQDISGEASTLFSSTTKQKDITADSLVEYLKVNKSKFC